MCLKKGLTMPALCICPRHAHAQAMHAFLWQKLLAQSDVSWPNSRRNLRVPLTRQPRKSKLECLSATCWTALPCLGAWLPVRGCYSMNITISCLGHVPHGLSRGFSEDECGTAQLLSQEKHQWHADAIPHSVTTSYSSYCRTEPMNNVTSTLPWWPNASLPWS